MCAAKEREKYEEKEKKTMCWLLHRLVGSMTGGRWKPMSCTEEGNSSFCKCVSVSDIGFAVHLLCHYSKKDSGDVPIEGKKNWRNHCDCVKTLAKYTEWCRQIGEVVSNTSDPDEEALDAWILALIKNEGNKEGSGEECDMGEQKREALANADICAGAGMCEEVEEAQTADKLTMNHHSNGMNSHLIVRQLSNQHQTLHN